MQDLSLTLYVIKRSGFDHFSQTYTERRDPTECVTDLDW